MDGKALIKNLATIKQALLKSNTGIQMGIRVKAVYKKWWFWVLLLVFIISIPFIINEFYLYGKETGKVYFTLWGAKDVLSFYGSFLAFIGTVVLGALALWQNDKAYKNNEDLTVRQLKMSAIENKNIELNLTKQTIKESISCFDINIFHILFVDIYMSVKKTQDLINLAQSNRKSIFNAGVNLGFLKNFWNNLENCQNCKDGCDFKETSEEYKRLLVDFRSDYQLFAKEFTELLTKSEDILIKKHGIALLKNKQNAIKKHNNKLLKLSRERLKDFESWSDKMLTKEPTKELFDIINEAEEVHNKTINSYFSLMEKNDALLEKIEQQLYKADQEIKEDHNASKEKINEITNNRWVELRNKAITFIKRCDLEMEDNFNNLINSRQCG